MAMFTEEIIEKTSLKVGASMCGKTVQFMKANLVKVKEMEKEFGNLHYKQTLRSTMAIM